MGAAAHAAPRPWSRPRRPDARDAMRGPMRCDAQADALRGPMRCKLVAMQCAVRGLVAFARCRRHHAFDGGIFRVGGEGLRYGRKDGWRNGWIGVMGLRVGFININDMYNNDVGKGVVYAYEAYEVK
jgi:hypothetical protein